MISPRQSSQLEPSIEGGEPPSSRFAALQIPHRSTAAGVVVYTPVQSPWQSFEPSESQVPHSSTVFAPAVANTTLEPSSHSQPPLKTLTVGVAAVAPPTVPSVEQYIGVISPRQSSQLEPSIVGGEPPSSGLAVLQIPHRSTAAGVVVYTPVQSTWQSSSGTSLHVPHWSSTASPLGVPAQSSQLESSPSQTPHASTGANPGVHVQSPGDTPAPSHELRSATAAVHAASWSVVVHVLSPSLHVHELAPSQVARSVPS